MIPIHAHPAPDTRHATREHHTRIPAVTNDLSDTIPSPPFDASALLDPAIPPRRFDLRDFGAIDDGRTVVTEAFRAAVAACAEAGGGTVRVPAGDWLTGPIHLRSNVALHLDEGALVRFSDRPKDYLPVVLTRWEGHHCYNYSPLIYAHDCDCAGTDIGVRLKSRRGRGGCVEDVTIERLNMTDVRREPIRINMYYTASSSEPLTDEPPAYRNIRIYDIRCRGAEHAFLLRGLPEIPLRNVLLKNIDIDAREGAIIEDVDGLQLENVRVCVDHAPAVMCNNLAGLTTDRTTFAVANTNYETRL